ncbi:hypothetical protein SDC9_120086 [bioreactor metagenome]|uniref:Uncharacterized protein n=1 Tax=bioreactor metagenome TaxID=1076179 RepID=A0A645C5S4_9ZZZZ
MRRALRVFAHAYGTKRFIDALTYFKRRYAQVFRAEGNVLFDNRRYELVVGVLEQQRRILAYFKRFFRVFGAHAINKDLAARRQVERVEVLCQR